MNDEKMSRDPNRSLSPSGSSPSQGEPRRGQDPETGQRPGYWAVLPAAVRYHPDLPASAKLLYAEISSLTDARGYCFASNGYFMKIYGLSMRTITRLLQALEDAGLVRIEDDQGGKSLRKIYAGINPMSYLDKNVYTPGQKCQGGLDKNVQENKKETRKEINPPKAPQGAAHEPEMFERFWKAYPCKKDKASARREWDKLKPNRKLMMTMSAALESQKASDEWRREIGIPYACRWLRNRRWEDEVETAAMPAAHPREELPWI